MYKRQIVDNKINVVSTATRDLTKFEGLAINDSDESYTLVVDNKAEEIVQNIYDNCDYRMDETVLQVSPFGISSNFRDSDKPTNTKNIKVICSRGRETYTDMDHVYKNQDTIDKWKVIVSRIALKSDEASTIIGNPMVIKPGEVCSVSYLVVDTFDTQEEAENVEAYLKTKFVRFLINTTLNGMNLNSGNFTFVPVPDTELNLTDCDLYNQFDLNSDEINYIESKVKAMS